MIETKLKAIIIDDENSAVNSLRIIINEYTRNIEVVGTATSAKEGLLLLETVSPHVVFIDIQMPYMNGFEFIEAVGDRRDFEIVFITAHNNYAQEAFKLRAFSYLLKPITIPDFLAVVNTLVAKIGIVSELKQKTTLKTALSNKICIPSSNGIEFIAIADIIRIEASGSYTTLYLVTGKPLLFAKNLKSIEELLSQHTFFRAHKSHLINVSFIKNFVSQKEGGVITMSDGSVIDLSRSHKEEFISLYKF